MVASGDEALGADIGTGPEFIRANRLLDEGVRWCWGDCCCCGLGGGGKEAGGGDGDDGDGDGDGDDGEADQSN